MTDTETNATPAKKPKRERSPEQQADRKAQRALARALCRSDSDGKGDLKTRWTDGKSEYMSRAKQLSKALARSGVTLSVSEAAAAEDDEAMPGDE